MSEPIRRLVAHVAGRAVHYRRVGNGPAVLLLHQSPASSIEMIPLMRQLAGSWTVIAPDTPGNGLSDPLALDQPTMADYAQALVLFMDALGIERAAIYGFHSGAACALAIAHGFPERVSVVVANGYSRMSREELADILAHYLVPLPLDWSGAHLAWIWARLREQYLFFPWYRNDMEHRLQSGIPRTEVLHAGVMDLLRAGDHYLKPYRAAFLYDRDQALCALRVPALIMTARNDALYRYLEQMPPPATSVRVGRPDNYAGACQLLLGMLREHTGATGRAPAVPVADARLPGLYRDALQLPEGSVMVWRTAASARLPGVRPVLFCHDSAGSADGMRDYMQPLVGSRQLLACDLPGNGETEHFNADTSLQRQVDCLAAAVATAGHASVDIVVEGDGAVLALELARRHPDMVHGLALANIAGFEALRSHSGFDADAVALPLQAHGQHLLTAWHRARDERLFGHWHSTRARQNRRLEAGELDPLRLQQRAIDLLKCRCALPAVLQERLAYPLEQALAALRLPNYRATIPWTPAGAAHFTVDAVRRFDDSPGSS